MFSFSSNATIRRWDWTSFKALLTHKGGTAASMQYDSSYSGLIYVWFYDGAIEINLCQIWTDTVPDDVIASGYTQVQNDADKLDFNTNYLSGANGAI